MILTDLNGTWPKWVENVGDELNNATTWVGEKVSDVANVVYDNTIGKIVGTDQVFYEVEYGGGSYEVVGHTGGDIIAIKRDIKGKFDSWSVNADISFGRIVSNKQSISGNGWNPESWKYTNDLEISTSNGLFYAGGLHIDKDGVGVQGSSSGTTGNMPLPLPDGTQIDEFGSASWNLTVESNIANWKQVVEAVSVTGAVAALVWVIANDASIIGILDDALVAPLCTYLATRAPAIFQWFSQLLPQMGKVINDLKPCIEGN